MWDREQRQVFSCKYPMGREELAGGIILHPHLWQGTEEPYLYRVRVSLMERNDYVADTIETSIAFRTFREMGPKGWFLNNKLFLIRAVAYRIPDRTIKDSSAEASRTAQIRQELLFIRQMGANTICPMGEQDRKFCEMCDEVGLVVWCGNAGEIPWFRGAENSLFTERGNFPTDLYYYYKACWSREPFVYISRDSFLYQQNGNAKLTVYSNQRKVALYVEGVLFEFQSGGPVYIFEEIPVRGIPLMLAAETGECEMSLTIY